LVRCLGFLLALDSLRDDSDYLASDDGVADDDEGPPRPLDLDQLPSDDESADEQMAKLRTPREKALEMEANQAVTHAPNGRKYAHEEPHHENWPKHKKHVFILSSAGKPIYSRYGDESSLAGFVGVIQAIISFIQDDDDTIRSMRAGDVNFVFVVKGPIYLVCVSRTGEPVAQLAEQLRYMHSQIISILTAGVNRIFSKRAQFDIRNLLSGTEKFLDSLMSWMDHDYSVVLNATHCLRLDSQTRNLIGSIMHSVKNPNLIFSILIARRQLVNLVRPRKHTLHPADLHLILNFVNSSTAFRTSETWTPICLPHFNDSGFLHAHVCFIATDICLVLIAAHQEDFYQMADCRNAVVQRFESGENSVMSILSDALQHQEYTSDDVRVPGLLHFVYKSLNISQIICSRLEAPYISRRERKRLFRMYQHVHEKAIEHHHKVYYHCSGKETVLAWITGGFYLYATFGPFESISNVIAGCNSLLQWVKTEENKAFVLDSPVFG